MYFIPIRKREFLTPYEFQIIMMKQYSFLFTQVLGKNKKYNKLQLSIINSLWIYLVSDSGIYLLGIAGRTECDSEACDIKINENTFILIFSFSCLISKAQLKIDTDFWDKLTLLIFRNLNLPIQKKVY